MTKPGCQQYPECSCPRDFYCIEGDRKRGCWPAVAIMVVMWIAIAWLFMWATGPAHAHQAHTASGAHVEYPIGCCHSAATSPNGDCAPIDDQYVREGPDGYEINLPVGSHPRLKTKGYRGVIPYSAARQPISNDFHICLATDGANRFCFFPKPGAV